MARGGLFSIGVGLFLAGGGLFLSPTVAEKSPTPAEKSPTAILKRCWTLEYFGELEFSSPFMEQWTLDARGVLIPKYPKKFKTKKIKNTNTSVPPVQQFDSLGDPVSVAALQSIHQT